MGFLYEKVVRPALFRTDPERAHEGSVRALALLGGLYPLRRAMEAWARLPAGLGRPIRAFGLDFPNAIGLAAGFDKNALAWPGAAALGFGHVEIGSVTAIAQPGNPRPRVFRYPSREAVINRMGFNNQGAAAIAARLRGQPARGRRLIPLGINLGKSKVVPVDAAAQDYLESFSHLADLADYLVLNVSSPNTPRAPAAPGRGPAARAGRSHPGGEPGPRRRNGRRPGAGPAEDRAGPHLSPD